MRLSHKQRPLLLMVVLLLALVVVSCEAQASTTNPTNTPRAVGTAAALVGTASILATVSADPTVALVRWPAVQGAAGYRVSLIRTSDDGVMQQQTVPASQLAIDAQPLFPGEQYIIAIESQSADGAYHPYTLSKPFSGRALDHNTFGFLDDGNIAAGPVNNTLWDRELNVAYDGGWGGSAFTNPQLHYHLSASNPPGTPNAGDQVVAPMTARVPFDFTNRTMTVSGMVDLKGDKHQWFGVALAPQPVGDTGIVDDEDRSYNPAAMPVIELFDISGQLELHYAAANSYPQVLASAENPIGINNVRDDVRWQVSATHYTVTIDGKKVMDGNWPAPLEFTAGYMTLWAQNYPGSGGSPQNDKVDGTNAAASIWHLDDWGFDAPSGKPQPQTAVYLPSGCAFYPGKESTYQLGTACAQSTISGTSSWKVTKVDTSDLASAYIALDGYRWQTAGALQVRVNNGTWETPTYQAESSENTMRRYVTVPVSDLVSGTNTIQVRKAANNASGDIAVSNVELVTLSTRPFAAPALPAQPDPLLIWSPAAWQNALNGTPTPTTSGTSATSPSISGVSPAHAAIGATIIIDGANLGDATAVEFNGIAGTGLMVHSPGELMVTVPIGATAGPLTVITPKGTAHVSFTVG